MESTGRGCPFNGTELVESGMLPSTFSTAAAPVFVVLSDSVVVVLLLPQEARKTIANRKNRFFFICQNLAIRF
jgi:hypothetical protein